MVAKGFYVHYKGGIYFVQGTAVNKDEGGDMIVIYESTQGCGDEVSRQEQGDRDLVVYGSGADDLGLRYRKLSEFVERVDWHTGLDDEQAYAKKIVNQGEMIPRFQRVVGWMNGVPLVVDPDGGYDAVYPFVTRFKKEE